MESRIRARYCLTISFSAILENSDVTEMGMKSEGFTAGLTFEIGVTFAYFQARGTVELRTE